MCCRLAVEGRAMEAGTLTSGCGFGAQVLRFRVQGLGVRG